jgi:hypothetical protein
MHVRFDPMGPFLQPNSRDGMIGVVSDLHAQTIPLQPVASIDALK